MNVVIIGGYGGMRQIFAKIFKDCGSGKFVQAGFDRAGKNLTKIPELFMQQI